MNRLQLLILVLLLCPLAVQAQSPLDSLLAKYPSRTELRELRKAIRREEFRVGQRNELRLTAGAFGQPGINPMGSGYFGGLTNDDVYIRDNSNRTFTQEELQMAKAYIGPEYYTGSYTVGYMRRVAPIIHIGASFTYSGLCSRVYSSEDNSRLGNNDRNYFSLVAMLRVNWFNSRLVSLYSSCGLGFAVGSESICYENVGYGKVHSAFTGQFTPFGISVGRRLYGFAEFGIGCQGVWLCGIGYKFGGEAR